MEPLDRLYGDGASEGFANALPGDPTEVLEIEVEGGHVRVNVVWEDATMKIECSETQVHYLALHSPGGLYTKLCDALPGFFKDLGVQTFTASPGDADSDAVLRRRGDWHSAKPGLVWEI